MYTSRVRPIFPRVRRFFKKRPKNESTVKAEQSSSENPRVKRSAETHAELLPDIYTQPNPQANDSNKIDWRAIHKKLQARAYVHYPHVGPIPDIFATPSHMFDLKSRGWQQNKPEMFHGMFLKDKVIYQFREKADVENWYCCTDHMFNGHSWAELTQSKNGKTICFRGYFSTELPRDRRPLPGPGGYRPFTYMQTKVWNDGGQQGWLDWSWWDTLRIRCRGDGRRYWVCFNSDQGTYDAIQGSLYKALLQTNGGPQWQTVDIPFVKFLNTMETSLHTEQESASPIRRNKNALETIDYLRIMLGQETHASSGPFQFEIDYIAVLKDDKEQLLQGWDGRFIWERKDYDMRQGGGVGDIKNVYYDNRKDVGRFADKQIKHKHSIPMEAYYSVPTRDS